ncbi:MAG: NADH-quinone oxidoreductase subunit A [Chloroflexi bacterium]|nr:NADH-quinone oxidoreductase subunit A [Chloroflexota bacterium]
MLGQFGYVGILLIVAILFPLGAIVTSWLLGKIRIRPAAPDPVKEDVYECGVPTEGPTWVQFNFRYYYLALLFVIFDIETVFLFPWAVAFRKLAVFGLVEMIVFIAILVVGLVYAWKQDALEWR